MRARFQSHINGAFRKQILIRNTTDRFNFGMWRTVFFVPAFAYYFALVHNHRTHHRVGTDAAKSKTGKLVVFGEVGLAGEIRPIPNGEERLREAALHGFKRAIVPAGNKPKKGMVGEMQVVGAATLAEALEAVAE